MNRKKLPELAKDIIGGIIPKNNIYKALLKTSDHDLMSLLHGADIIRDFYFGREVHLCTICNAKSGRCSEDCKFCSQSAFARTDAPIYPLMEKDELKKAGLYSYESPVNRYSMVTTGKKLPKKEVKEVAEAMGELEGAKIGKCASLGVLERDELQILKSAGMTRYHHNLETCQSYFNQVCTTHSYEERVNTILEAKKMGIEICAGGIFGLGETNEHIFELALALKKLNVDAIPINFLTPIKGTPFEFLRNLTPLRCLKIIAFFRYYLPNKEIIICGGRGYNLKELHSMIFYAGASGIMTGNYLTTEGRTLQRDLEMIYMLGFTVRAKVTGQKSQSAINNIAD